MRVIALPVLAGGRSTGQTVELASSLPLAAIPEHIRWMGYRLTVTCRGRLAVERLH